MKKLLFKKFAFVFLLTVLFISNSVLAEDVVDPQPEISTSIHLNITTPDSSLFDEDLDVTACDSDNDPETEDTITAYCAILQSGLESSWNWAWTPGAFVDSISDIAGYTSQDSEGNDVYHYWAWSLNGEMAMTALNQYELQTSDSILLEFVDPQPELTPQPEISTSIHLNITTPDSSLFDEDLDVTACDSDNDPETEDTITAYCAILQSGLESSWNWAWTPGAFVDSISDIAGYTSQDSEGNDVYHYWAWSLNGEMAMTALNQYELQTSDSILLEFVDPQEEIITEEDPTPEAPSSGGSSGGSSVSTKVFSIPQAISFLSSNQNSDGSFSGDMYTDWVAIGIAKAGSEAETLKTKIYNYLINQDFNSSLVTNYERHAMALMSLGINPYDGTEINYIKKIIDSFDGTQLKDSLSDYEDDIFGLIVLQNVGYEKDDEMISKIISYILSKQSSNGSWGSVDMTGAGIMALKNFEDVDGVLGTISKAENYIIGIGEQKSDGSFGNSFATSWAIQALSLNNSYDDQVKDAIEYLTNQQQNDGGVDDISNSIDSRVWATAYSIPAILHLSWNDILNNFSKPAVITSGGSSYTPTPILFEEPIDNKNSEEEEKENPNSGLMATSETISPVELIENNIPKVKKPINKVIAEKENTPEDIKIVKNDEVDNVESSLLQASAASSSGSRFLSGSKIILLISGILMVVLWGFVLKFKV